MTPKVILCQVYEHGESYKDYVLILVVYEEAFQPYTYLEKILLSTRAMPLSGWQIRGFFKLRVTGTCGSFIRQSPQLHMFFDRNL